VKISTKTKVFSKIFEGVTLGPRYYRFIEKTRAQKFHATVPLNWFIQSPCSQGTDDIYDGANTGSQEIFNLKLSGVADCYYWSSE